MQLSIQQQSTVLSWIAANAAGQGDDAIAAMLNAAASPAYFVWRPDADKATVDGQIVKSNYTPTDAPPASGSTVQISNDQLLYNNRALACQLKQTNAQWLTSGPAALSTINAQLASVRQNFKDCLLTIPSGAGGANQDAGWGTASVVGAVRTALMRTVTVCEKLFVTATSGAGNVGTDARGVATNPDLLGVGSDGLPVQGTISGQQVSDIRGGL